MKKKIIVVGASSGIGAEIADQLLKAGNSVVMVARRDREMKNIAGKNPGRSAFVIKNDIADFQKVAPLFKKAVQELGGLDEIYFAAGIMEKTGPLEFNIAKDVRTIQINLVGAFAWLNPAAEFFSRNGSGKIIGISSIAGDRGRKGNVAYNTSKAALNTYLEALRNRLAAKNVKVLTVKPGFIDTDMTRGMPGLFWLISAKRAAEIIIQAANSGKENIYVPARWGIVAFIIRNIPSFIFKKLSV